MNITLQRKQQFTSALFSSITFHFYFLPLQLQLQQYQKAISSNQSSTNHYTDNMTSESFLEPKAVLDSVKSSSWKFFNFRVADGDVDRSYVHCKLCFDTGNRKRAQVKYCEGTTNLTLHLKTWHKADYKAMVKKEEPPEVEKKPSARTKIDSNEKKPKMELRSSILSKPYQNNYVPPGVEKARKRVR